jgi:hypothetical protein
MASVKIPDYQLKEYTGGYQSVLLLSAISLPIRSGTNCPHCSGAAVAHFLYPLSVTQNASILFGDMTVHFIPLFHI